MHPGTEVTAVSEPRSLNCEAVVVYTSFPGREWPSAGAVVKPHLVEIGGHTFISGTIRTEEGHWSNGRRVHFRVDSIVSLVEFASLEEFYHWDDARRQRRSAGKSQASRDSISAPPEPEQA